MDNMEERLGAILSNPQLMQQIMTMAGSLSGGPEEKPQEVTANQTPDFDPAMIQKIMGMAGTLRVNEHQQNLLMALRPYLTEGRIQKLEKAMRAVKLANMASAALNSGALSLLTGR